MSVHLASYLLIEMLLGFLLSSIQSNWSCITLNHSEVKPSVPGHFAPIVSQLLIAVLLLSFSSFVSVSVTKM